MTTIDLDELRRRATAVAEVAAQRSERYPQTYQAHLTQVTFEFHSAWTPEVCLRVLDTLYGALMERNEARAEVTELLAALTLASSYMPR